MPTQTTEPARARKEIPNLPWEAAKTEIKEDWYGVGTVGRLLRMGALDRSHRLAERLAKKTQDGTLGHPEASDSTVEDEMGIQVGDNTITHHHHSAPTSVPVSPAAVPSDASQQPPQVPKLLKAAAIAALVLGGGGAGAGLTALLVNRPQMTDTDTKYELRLAKPIGEQ